MNNYRTLTKVLFKNGNSFQVGSKRGKLLLIIVVAAFLPMLFLESVQLWDSYALLSSAHLTETVLTGLLTAACLAMILFGIFYIISAYYFADDIVSLLTMPLLPSCILAAKFTVILLSQYFLEALIALPALIVFGLRGGNIFYWVNAVLVFVLLPLIPTVICSVISVAVMAFSPFFRNKDRMKLFAGLLAFVFAIVFSVFPQFLSQNTSFSRMLTANSGILEKTASIFPSSWLAGQAVFDGTAVSLLWLMAFAAFSAAAVAVFLWLGSRLYLSGVVGLTQNTGRRRKKAEKTGLQVRRRSVPLAIALKDWRLLLRTPIYALNCVVSAILMPPLVIFCMAMTMRKVTIPHGDITVVAVGVLLLSFVSVLNMISFTAISREGKDAVVLHYIPVTFRRQIIGKLIPGLALSLADLLLTLVIGWALLRLDVLTVAAVGGLSVPAVVAGNLFGLFFDVAFPKLDWDDETAAVKRNLNVAVDILVVCVALCPPLVLVNLVHLTFGAAVLLMAAYQAVLLAVSAFLLFAEGPSLFYGPSEKKRPSGR